MKATIYDVAREAGVSIAAVSQVINGKGKISEERRNEIIQVMERLNYKPSVIAAALTGKKTYTLGLLVPDISNPFFAEIARAVEDRAHDHGYSVVICSTDNRGERVDRYISLLVQKSVDGMIIGTGMENKDLIAGLKKKRIPVAAIARDMPELDVRTVIVDDRKGGGLAARHLAAFGHKRIAVLAEHPKVVSSRERITGFREALAEAGLSVRDEWILAGEADLLAAGRRLADGLLRGSDRPTAVFCCNDLLAIGALQAAKGLGLRVPEDVSIVGFDDTILATVTDPALTTVSQPIQMMGRMAADLILEGPVPGEPAKRIVLQPELVIRQSTQQFCM